MRMLAVARCQALMLCCTAVMLLSFGCECDAGQVLLSEHEKLLQQLAALRERDHQQHHQQQQQHVLHDSAPKKFLEVEHTNGSCNSSGEGSGWTEVSLAPQVMEMKQASCCGADTFFLCSTLSCSNHVRVVVTHMRQADLAAKSIRRFLRNLDTGACRCPHCIVVISILTIILRPPPHVPRCSTGLVTENNRGGQRADTHTRIRHRHSGEP